MPKENVCNKTWQTNIWTQNLSSQTFFLNRNNLNSFRKVIKRRFNLDLSKRKWLLLSFLLVWNNKNTHILKYLRPKHKQRTLGYITDWRLRSVLRKLLRSSLSERLNEWVNTLHELLMQRKCTVVLKHFPLWEMDLRGMWAACNSL